MAAIAIDRKDSFEVAVRADVYQIWTIGPGYSAALAKARAYLSVAEVMA